MRNLLNCFCVMSFCALVSSMGTAQVPEEAGTSTSEVQSPPTEEVPSNDEMAKRTFVEGRTAFDAKDYETAAAKFEGSYELSRKPALLFNIGSAYDRLGRKDEAIKHYEAYLAAVPEASNRSYVTSRLVLLKPKPEPEPKVEMEKPSRLGPVMLMSLAGAAAVTSAVTGVMALSAKNELDAMCDNGACPPSLMPTFNRKHRLSVVSDVFLALSAAALAGGIVWWIVGTKRARKNASNELTLNCSLFGCQVGGSW